MADAMPKSRRRVAVVMVRLILAESGSEAHRGSFHEQD